MANKKQKNRAELTILRDEGRIERFQKIARWVSLVGMIVLIGGLAMIFIGEDTQLKVSLQLVSLLVGWLMAQVGLFLTHRYLRKPRPDEVLDKALKKASVNGRVYHYVMPASHVLLTPHGVTTFALKFQQGDISVEGDKWRQGGIGMRRFFGQEGLGNPSRDARFMLGAVNDHIERNVPDLNLEDVPVSVLIVFTHVDKKRVDLKKSTFPAVHHSQVGQFLRQQKGETMPPDLYDTLQQLFDGAATKKGITTS